MPTDRARWALVAPFPLAVVFMSTFIHYVAQAGLGIAGEAIMSDLYRKRAAECMKLSMIACDTAIREGYRKLAEAYLKLANVAEGGSFRLSDDYVTTATQDVALQLSRAGVRLAFVLNNALRRQ
jgi:hypothetical protein